MRKSRRIVLIILAVALLAAGLSQCVFLLRYPYFRQYAVQNSVSLREARKAWGRPDKVSEQVMGMTVEASRENWQKVAELAASGEPTGVIWKFPDVTMGPEETTFKAVSPDGTADEVTWKAL
jgi:hypothetical protein